MDITVEKPTPRFLEERGVFSWGIWEKGISRFDWHYDTTEECYILEGEVVVETADGRKVSFAGRFCDVPEGVVVRVGYQEARPQAL